MEFEIPNRISRYIKRITGEYKRYGLDNLATILEKSKYEIRTGTAVSTWGNDDTVGHDLILLVPDNYIHLVPLDKQNDIAIKMAQDINTASSISSEFIDTVYFEYLDEEDFEQSVDEKTVDRLWKPNFVKLFISHRDTDKQHAHRLASELESYGISSFVAHDSIEPDEDWQNEIEKALISMDVMLTLITDEFFDSAWTNQEIGFALARNIPIISYKAESRDPIGFIRNRQAIVCPLSEITLVASLIADTVQKRLDGNPIIRRSAIRRFSDAKSFSEAAARFNELQGFDTFTPEDIDQIATAYEQNSQLSGCYHLNRGDEFTDFINKHSTIRYQLNNGKLEKFKSIAQTHLDDDDIPF